ncbi:MAG: hypothetical protein IT291_01810 [Deltaproteobacteria bacterium]|nr:hypothetical protein [Deltaproteobacteria bacterium]
MLKLPSFSASTTLGYMLRWELLLAFFPPAVFGQTAISAEQSPVVASPATVTSFVGYDLDMESFRPELEEVVALVRESSKLVKEGNLEGAKTLLLKAKASCEAMFKTIGRGSHDELYFLLGMVNEYLGDSKAAIENFESSLRLKANNPVAIFKHATLLKTSRRYNEAISEFLEVTWRADFAKHEPYFLMAECQKELGQHDAALASLEKSLAANPSYVPALSLLIKTRSEKLATTNDPQQKADLEGKILLDLKTLVSIDPSNRENVTKYVRATLNRSDPFFDRQSLQSAESLVRAIVEASSYKDSSMVKLLFDAQLKQRNLDNAERTLKLGLEQAPKSSILLNATKQLDLEKNALLSDR